MTMKFEAWLTRGMFGEKAEKIAEAETREEAMAACAAWKEGEGRRRGLKVERYDRLISKDGETAVDFGDYFWFFLVEEAGA